MAPTPDASEEQAKKTYVGTPVETFLRYLYAGYKLLCSPSNSLYVHNLDENIKIPDLRQALTDIFEGHGTIIDIVARKNVWAKGQAFVIFDNPDSVARAIHDLNEFPLLEKAMRLDFARSPSDAVMAKNCTPAEFDAHQRKRKALKERKQALEEQQAREGHKSKRPLHGQPVPPDAAREPAAVAKKTGRGAGLKSTGASTAVIPDEYLPPNKTLFLQSVPEDETVEDLQEVFGAFPGLVEARLVNGRVGIGFVEYNTDTDAITAKEGTDRKVLKPNTAPIKVTFRRK